LSIISLIILDRCVFVSGVVCDVELCRWVLFSRERRGVDHGPSTAAVVSTARGERE
jgi:hypothetical protein